MPEVRNLTVTCRYCPAQKKKKNVVHEELWQRELRGSK